MVEVLDNFFASPFSNAEIISLEIVCDVTSGAAINVSMNIYDQPSQHSSSIINNFWPRFCKIESN